MTKVLNKEREESEATWREVHAALERETYDRMWAKLVELPQALALSQAEAVQRYRGKEDGLLCTLLDPQTRLAAQLVLGLPDSVWAELRQEASGDPLFRRVLGRL